MTLLHAGVDTSTIALWLGHASTKATDVYLHADLALKEKALARTAPPAQRGKRYHPTDSLLAFLESCSYAGPTAPLRQGERRPCGPPGITSHPR